MTVRRWLYGLLAPAGLLGLPACGTGPLLPLRDPDQPQLIEAAARTTPRKKERDFGILPAAPGEIVPRSASTGVLVSAPTTVGKVDTQLPSNAELVNKNEKNPLTNVGDATDATPPLVRAFRDLHDGDPEAALGHLSGFDKPNQELLLQLMPAVVRVSQLDTTQPDPEETANLARQFESVAAALTKRTGMTVRKAVLCDRVDGYGRFSPVRNRNELRHGEVYPLYVEVGNVPCEPETRSGRDGYVVRLDVSMQVTDDLGKVIEIVDRKTDLAGPKSTAEKVEFSYSPVHDYFVEARFRAPTRPGAYTVTIEVRDPKSGRVVSRPVPFRVQ